MGCGWGFTSRLSEVWGAGALDPLGVGAGQEIKEGRGLDLHTGSWRGTPGPGLGCSPMNSLGRIAWSPSVTASGARGRAKPLILTSQVPLSQPPEEELERLTKKLVHDMNHPPSGEYFGG